jgi:hypothetical protein
MQTTTISKEKARELIQMYLNSHNNILPIYDANIIIDDESGGKFTITEYTFRYLLKIAYDLTDIKLNGL